MLIFLLFLLIGISGVGGYRYIIDQQKGSKLIVVPTVTTKFSLSNAPSDSLKGTIASMSGIVKWQSRVATKPVKITSPRIIQQGESLSTGKNGKTIVIIKNDSLLSLAPNTDISFIQLLPVNFVLEQNNGVVTYQNNYHVPISVRSFNLISIISGGSMQISVNEKDKTTTITVMKGIVREGYEDVDNNSTVVTVNAGEIFSFDDTTRSARVTKIPGFVQQSSTPFSH